MISSQDGTEERRALAFFLAPGRGRAAVLGGRGLGGGRDLGLRLGRPSAGASGSAGVTARRATCRPGAPPPAGCRRDFGRGGWLGAAGADGAAARRARPAGDCRSARGRRPRGAAPRPSAQPRRSRRCGRRGTGAAARRLLGRRGGCGGRGRRRRAAGAACAAAGLGCAGRGRCGRGRTAAALRVWRGRRVRGRRLAGAGAGRGLPPARPPARLGRAAGARSWTAPAARRGTPARGLRR